MESLAAAVAIIILFIFSIPPLSILLYYAGFLYFSLMAAVFSVISGLWWTYTLQTRIRFIGIVAAVIGLVMLYLNLKELYYAS